ncbi:hypothetical protein K435DRAFT_786987 [Dendrothele bispora CBS 962.96]|uniref:Uncharacterized protein n=1 Tax=Dendrothele bispora (strain CBS 962.96) TaxID=1314807 RepID=A0A4S8KMU5_DENBC|nr:hypothetical protein K435DRAFT_786987 [Dendrothele bispora CBS 962.96]
MSARATPNPPQTFSWPSLYNPHSELFNIEHHGPVQPGGVYLSDAGDVFRFTLYWMFVFYIPIFVAAGLYAFLNLTFPPSRGSARKYDVAEDGHETDILLETFASPTQAQQPSNSFNFLSSSTNTANRYQSLRSTIKSPGGRNSPSQSLTPRPSSTLRPTKKQNVRRSRVTFALLVLLTFIVISLLGSLISSAILGFVLKGLYKAGNFHISTWVPFLWALIHVLIGMLNVWPSVIDFI